MRKRFAQLLITFSRIVYTGKCAECGSRISADSRTGMCSYCYYS